jgi:hypothetical protein
VVNVPTKLSQVRKFLVAVGTAIVEIAAVWLTAPPWFITLAAIAGALLVYRVPNEPMPS